MDQLLGYGSDSDGEEQTDDAQLGRRKPGKHDPVGAQNHDLHAQDSIGSQPNARSQAAGPAESAPDLCAPPLKRPRDEHEPPGKTHQQRTRTRTPAADANSSAHEPKSTTAGVSGGGLPNPLALLAASSSEELHGMLLGTAAPSIPDPRPRRVRAFEPVLGTFPTTVFIPVLEVTEALDTLYRRVRRVLPDLQPVTPDPLTPDELVATAAGRAAAAAAKRAAAAAAAAATNGSKSSTTTSSSKGPQAAAASAPCPPSAPLGPLQRGYHVSLSRTVPIRQHQIAPLTGDLAAELGAQPGPVTLSLGGLRSFTNDNGTRSFVAAMVHQGAEQVCGLIARVDAAFTRHGLPAFYKPALPHVSVGWLPGDQSKRINEALERIQGRQQQQQQQQQQEEGQGRGGSTSTEAEQPQASEPEVVCTWTPPRAVCIVGIREYEVWRPA